MSGSVNKVIIVGNVCADPETRSMGNGGEVCNISVATNESYKKNGEWVNNPEYHRVVIFNEHLIKIANSYLKKGSKVYLEGQLKTRKWQDQQGNDKYSTEIVLAKFKGELTMLDRRDSQSGGQQEPTGSVGDLDDEIGF